MRWAVGRGPRSWVRYVLDVEMRGGAGEKMEGGTGGFGVGGHFGLVLLGCGGFGFLGGGKRVSVLRSCLSSLVN